jgi:16S rRNA (cytosine1402-N4)-methyltransferase
MAPFAHTSVMVGEVLDALAVGTGRTYCDATVGGGGHARAILERSAPDGRLIGIDRDPVALEASRAALSSFGERATLCHGNFAELCALLARAGLQPVDGVLVDLGVSSQQLTTAERGFGFTHDGPLDMRMDPGARPTAAKLIAELPERELARVIRDYGEEPASTRIARAVKRAHARGALAGTADLARVVADALGGRRPRAGRIHPATRTFMALRMAVNDELGALARFLATFSEALRPGGRVVVIAFHSLEDRAVKQAFARLANPCSCPPSLPLCACGRRPQIKVLTRRPLRASPAEVAANPRSRSARLRAAEVLA